MTLIQPININDVNVFDITLPPITQRYSVTPGALPFYNPVTVPVGVPLILMPGCVEAHPESKPQNPNDNLVKDDEDGAKVYCDAGMPSFDAMDYTPENLIIQREIETPVVDVPPPPDTPEVEPPDIPPTEEEVPCPGLNAPRIGDIAQNKEEKVSGFELQTDPATNKEICVTLYEDIPALEALLPDVQTVSTTAVIATVATGSALLAKPLADLLLRVFRPAIKKGVTTFQTKVLKKAPRQLSRSEIQTNHYRKSKGLDPFSPPKKKKAKE